MDDPILEAKFHAGNPAYKDDRFDYLKANLDYYSKELHRVGVDKKTLWQEYRIANEQGYGYSQFCFHWTQQRRLFKKQIEIFYFLNNIGIFTDIC